MKKIFLPLFIVLSISLFAKAQSWEWAKSAGGTSPDDSGNSIATDESGNVLVTGNFRSPSISFGSTLLTNAGANDIFTVKYNTNGNVLWAKSAGGASFDEGLGITTDHNGNVLVTGRFASSSITFGSTMLTNGDTTGTMFDIFIVKYDSIGNVLWAKSAGGTSSDQSNSIAIDDSGNVFVTGYFTSPSITFGTTTLTMSFGSFKIFTVKYDPNGNVLWAKSSDGTNSEDAWCLGITTDGNRNVFVTGRMFSPTLIFGSDTLTSEGTSNIFTVKYDANGNVLWARSTDGTSSNAGMGITADISGNTYVTGSFGTPITFGAFTLTSSGGTDIFTVKYDVVGNVLWAKSAGGAYGDLGTGIATDNNGHLYITGYYYGYFIQFGSSTIANTNSSGVYDDIFVMKYDDSGNAICANGAGGIVNDDALAVATDGNGNVYITGNFDSPTIAFGSTTLTNANAGSSDIFVAKLGTGTSVKENILSDEIRTFPNPFFEKLSIESKQNPILNVEVYNEIGQKTYSLHSGGITDPEQKSPHYELLTQNWPSGFYVLEIKTSQGMFRVKAIKL